MTKVRKFIQLLAHFSNWYTFLLDYFGLVSKKTIKYNLRNGITFFARPLTHDKLIIYETWVENTYNPPNFGICVNDTVVDVGAYIGDFAIYAAQKTKGGRVFALEPFPKNYYLLTKNIKANHLKNVFALELAMSDKNGRESIYISNNNSGGHSTVKEYVTGKNLKVKSISLDTFVAKYKIDKIDFLKMDCEGSEYKILYSASQKVLNKIVKIAMEYHPIDAGRNIASMSAFLRRNGFKLYENKGKEPILYAYRHS